MKTEITREDFLQFHKHVYYGKRLKSFFLIGMGLVTLWVIIINIGEAFDVLYFIAEFMILFVIWSLFFVVLRKIGLSEIKKMPDDKGSTLGYRTYLIEEKGFRSISELGETFTNWKGLKKIQESQDYYYLFIDKMVAYIIPKRSFLNKIEEKDFINTINEKISK